MRPVSQFLGWWHGLPTLASRCEGRENNLNFLRMILASIVLISHSWAIARGPAELEPLAAYFGITLGTFGVYGFFLLSGILVTQSFFRRHDLAMFIAARGLRIYPGLATTLIISTFILGPFITTLPIAEYFAAPQTWLFVLHNLSLVKMQNGLPGVFEHVPFGQAVNGSLWTLFYEVTCYALLAIAAALGVFRNFRVTLVTLAFAGIMFFIGNCFKSDLGIRLAYFEDLAPFFVLGIAVYILRSHLRLSVTVAILAMMLTVPAALITGLMPPMLIAASYAIFTFGYQKTPILSLYNRLGDYSYGTYIYAFPVQQTLAHILPGIPPVKLAVAALPITLFLAVLSWRFVERPALALKKYLNGEA